MQNASLQQVCGDNRLMYALMLLALLDLLLLEFALNSQVLHYAVWVATELEQAAGGTLSTSTVFYSPILFMAGCQLNQA